jgi:para-nitrobenzyl esterase
MSTTRRNFLGSTLAAAAAASLPAVSAEAEAPKAAAPSNASENLHPPVVTVKEGQLQGYRDGKTAVFVGVPYAQAERFEQPKPVTPWQGIRNAQIWGAVCPAPPQTTTSVDDFVFPHRYWIENEHCHFLNIWTQNASTAVKKPVMVWFHGGGFTNGSSMEGYSYSGKNLSEFGDVVVVSVNHRLNVIGTMDLSAYGPDYALSRYTGTADLVASLQWVQANIAQFGGDPGNVTIFGQSGGGSKVARMFHTPSAKGLFHRGICQSGGSEVFADMRDPAGIIKLQQAISEQTLKNLNLTGADIDKLKKVPYLDLLAANQAAMRSLATPGVGGGGWNPFPDDNYVLREFCDWASDIPLMLGSTFSEFAGNLQKGPGKNDWTPAEVDQKLTAAFGDKKDAIVAAFKVSFPRKKIQDVLYYVSPNTGALAAKVKAGSAKGYHYIFVYEYPVNGGTTSFHCSEIAFAFHNLSEPQLRLAVGNSTEAFALQDKVARMWLNFAKTGNPSQPGLEFKPFTPEDPQTMVIDTVSESRNIHAKDLAALLPRTNAFGIGAGPLPGGLSGPNRP